MAQRPLTPAELLAMPDDPFKRIIEDECKGPKKSHPDGTSAALRTPEVIDRTYYTIIRMHKNTEGQLAAWTQDLDAAKGDLLGRGRSDQEYLQTKGGMARRRAAAVRFKTGLEVLLQEIKHLRRANRPDGDAFLAAECARLGARVDELEAAIRRHRDSYPADDSPGDDDLDLWKLATPGDITIDFDHTDETTSP